MNKMHKQFNLDRKQLIGLARHSIASSELSVSSPTQPFFFFPKGYDRWCINKKTKKCKAKSFNIKLFFS